MLRTRTSSASRETYSVLRKQETPLRAKKRGFMKDNERSWKAFPHRGCATAWPLRRKKFDNAKARARLSLLPGGSLSSRSEKGEAEKKEEYGEGWRGCSGDCTNVCVCVCPCICTHMHTHVIITHKCYTFVCMTRIDIIIFIIIYFTVYNIYWNK